MYGVIKKAKSLGCQIHGRIGDLWWYTLLGFVVNRLGEVVNLVIGIFIVPRYISTEEIGAITPLMSLAPFLSLPIAILLIPVGKFLNVFATRREYGKVRALLTDSLRLSLVFAALLALWLSFVKNALLTRVHLNDGRILVPVAIFAALSCVAPIVDSAQRALKCFRGMLVSGLVSPYVRLGGMLLLLAPFGTLGYITTQLAMSLVSLGIGLLSLHLFLRNCAARVSYREDLAEMLRYSLPLIAFTIVSRIQAPVETIVIRHRLPMIDSAAYYYVALFGAIPGYATAALVTFFWPIVSERFERGASTGNLLMQSMLFNALAGAITLCAVVLLSPYIFAIKSAPWHEFRDYSGFVWQVGLITILKSMQAIYLAHQSACRHFTYVKYMVPLMLLEAATLYGLAGWSGLQRYLPSSLWQGVDALWENSLSNFLAVTIVFNILFVVCMTIEWWCQRRNAKLMSVM